MGERVVTRGNFKIDSALQIQGKPSMMNPLLEDSIPMSERASAPSAIEHHHHFELPPEFASRVEDLMDSYLGLQEALAGDSPDVAKEQVGLLSQAIESLPPAEASWEGLEAWRESVSRLGKTVKSLSPEADIAAIRRAFYPLSESLHDLVLHFGNSTQKTLKWTFCPMALDAGAYWIQSGTSVANPYYGASMLRCGEFKETFPGQLAEGK